MSKRQSRVGLILFSLLCVSGGAWAKVHEETDATGWTFKTTEACVGEYQWTRKSESMLPEKVELKVCTTKEVQPPKVGRGALPPKVKKTTCTLIAEIDGSKSALDSTKHHKIKSVDCPGKKITYQ